MKIVIEAQRIFRANKHGMDFVALESIRQLQLLDKVNQYYILVSPGEDRCLEQSDNFKIIELRCPTYPLWEQVAVPMALRKIKPDILHCTSNTAPIYCNIPLIITLHDIIFLEKRHGRSSSLYQNLGWYYRQLVVPCILPKCKKIITVSNFECNRISEVLKIGADKIVAIYNGYSNHFQPVENSFEVTQKYLHEKKYLFFLGNTDPKKNTARTLVGYSLYLAKSTRKRPLLIADINENEVDIILKNNQIESIKPNLRFSGYIPNSDLPSIYSGAYAFLYTSLRESFGIPILEAMACGTPLITSNTSSMPEIAGEGAILIDPRSEQDICDQILKLESDEDFYQQQVDYGLSRVKLFSWAQTAQKMLATYELVAEGTSNSPR